MKATVTVRDAVLGDAEAIRQIYNHEVTTGTSTFDIEPRSPLQQRDWMQQRSGVHLVIVAVDDDGEVMGFASLSQYKQKPCYSTTVENSIYVSPDHQRKGVGRALMSRVIELAREHGFHSIIARVVAENTGSVLLHEAVGYDRIGLEKQIGRKFGRWLDLQVLQLML